MIIRCIIFFFFFFFFSWKTKWWQKWSELDQSIPAMLSVQWIMTGRIFSHPLFFFFFFFFFFFYNLSFEICTDLENFFKGIFLPPLSFFFPFFFFFFFFFFSINIFLKSVLIKRFLGKYFQRNKMKILD